MREIELAGKQEPNCRAGLCMLMAAHVLGSPLPSWLAPLPPSRGWQMLVALLKRVLAVAAKLIGVDRNCLEGVMDSLKLTEACHKGPLGTFQARQQIHPVQLQRGVQQFFPPNCMTWLLHSGERHLVIASALCS